MKGDAQGSVGTGSPADPPARAWRRGLLFAVTLAALLISAVPVYAAITRIDFWGGDGSGDGQLHFPAFDAVDHAGNIYVVDQHNSRIVKFSPTGEFLLTWGWGVKNGQPRLQTCTNDCQAGLIGSGKGQLNGGYGIAVHSGRVYVTDPANGRIQVFTPTGRLLNIWGREGSRSGQFSSPHGIAVDADGRVYVADTGNDRIQKFSAGGVFLDKWGRPGSRAGEFAAPWGVATNGSDHLYVSDYFNNRVEKYTLAGRFLRTWGWGVRTGAHRFEICTRNCLQGDNAGSEDGQLSLPEGIATDSSGAVYVVGPCHRRIQKFAPGGHYITQFRTGRVFGIPHGVAIDRSDRIYVVYSRGYVVEFAQGS